MQIHVLNEFLEALIHCVLQPERNKRTLRDKQGVAWEVIMLQDVLTLCFEIFILNLQAMVHLPWESIAYNVYYYVCWLRSHHKSFPALL
jgi:hypothetical protein